MRFALRSVLVAAVAVALGACAQTPGGGFVISLDPAAVELVRGGQVAVTVNVAGGGNETVQLGISGLPAGVTASFAPATLVGGATTSTLTLAAETGASEGATEVTVTAVRGTTAISATLDLTVTSLTVSGRVVGLLRNGLPGVNVTIGSTTVTTDAAGEFTIGGITVPYDLVAFRAGAEAFGHVFRGMTTAEPEIVPVTALGGDELASATIEGSLPAAVPAGSAVRLCVEGLSTMVFGCTTALATDIDYQLNVTWAGGGAVSVRIHVLPMTVDGDDVPTGYSGYATFDGNVAEGGTATINVSAYGTAPSWSTITGTMMVPAAYDPSGLFATTAVTAAYSLPTFANTTTATSPFSMLVPLIGTQTNGVLAQATGPANAITIGWRSGVAPGANVTFDLPAAAVLTSPADAVTNVTTSTTFSAATAAGAVSTFIFQSGGNPRFAVTTTASSTTIPNLATSGVALPSGADYFWYVIDSHGLDSVDEAGARWLGDYIDAALAGTAGGAPLDHDGFITQSAFRDFSTP